MSFDDDKCFVQCRITKRYPQQKKREEARK